MSGVGNTDFEQTWQFVWTLWLAWTDLMQNVRVSGIAGTLFANMADFQCMPDYFWGYFKVSFFIYLFLIRSQIFFPQAAWAFDQDNK